MALRLQSTMAWVRRLAIGEPTKIKFRMARCTQPLRHPCEYCLGCSGGHVFAGATLIRSFGACRIRSSRPTTQPSATAPVATPPPPPPPRVTIKFFGVMISPTKSNRQPWDGVGVVPASTVSGITEALQPPNAYAAAGEILAQLASRGTQPPYPAGRVSLLASGRPVVTRLLPKIQDNYQPTWILRSVLGRDAHPADEP